MPAIQRYANGGLRKNAGDLNQQLADRIVKAVRKTPLSLRAAAYAVGMVQQDLRYIIKRGSLPGADPLWADTSRRIRGLIARAEAKNFARLQAAADGGTFKEVQTEGERVSETVKLVPANVRAQQEIQRQIEKDTWQVDPHPDDAPIVYMALFSRPLELPADILEALIANGWHHAALDNPIVSEPEARQLESETAGTPDGSTS